MALGINVFLSPANLLSGGVTGIALILNKILSIKTGLIVFLINVPLFIIAFYKLDKKFTILSLIGMCSLSCALVLSEPITGSLQINDKILLSIYGGTLSGIGNGIVFINHGSTGGSDIISMLIKKKFSNMNLGQLSFGLNLLIISIGSAIYGIISGLYTLLAMYITSLLLDKVINGFNAAKLVLIVTNKDKELTNNILEKLERGVTKITCSGGYTNNNKTILYCVVPFTQLQNIKDIVKTIDKEAFITITDTSEIVGKGFNFLN